MHCVRQDMHTVASINSEIRICQRELYALGAEEAESFMSVIAKCIADFYELHIDSKRDFVKHTENMVTERYYKYTIVRGLNENSFESLGARLRRLARARVELSPHLFSIHSLSETAGWQLQAGVGVLEKDPLPRVILFKLNSLSSKILFNHCVFHGLTAAQTMAMFDFFYQHLVFIRKEQDDVVTFISEGRGAQERADEWIRVIDASKDPGNASGIYANYMDILTRLYPLLECAGGGFNSGGVWTVTDIKNKMSPGVQYAILFEGDKPRFKARKMRDDTPVFNISCGSHEELVYRLCAEFEYEGKESMVCNILRDKYSGLADVQVEKTGRRT
jgi:hypothetical protein